MGKVSFLGFDFTPRRVLWAKINEKDENIAILEESLEAAELERIAALKKCAQLQDKLDAL